MANDIGGWLVPSFPDICLMVEEKPREKSQAGKLTRQWSNPGPLAERQRCYPFNTEAVWHVRCCCRVLRHFLTSKVISVASDIEREKSNKFCSEALISAWGSFTYRKSTTRDPRLYFPSEGNHTQDFYALKNPSTPVGIEPAKLGSRGEYDNHWTTGVDLHVREAWVT